MSVNAKPSAYVSSGGEIRTICRCDDVNGDQSNIVQYFDAYSIKVQGQNVSTTFLGSFTSCELETEYTVVSPVQCDALGDPAFCKIGRRLIGAGEAWSPTVLTKAFSIRVSSIADPNNGPVFIDSFGNETPLRLNEDLGYDCKEDFIDQNFSVIANSAEIYINYTELGT